MVDVEYRKHKHVTRKHLAISLTIVLLLFIVAQVFTLYFLFLKSTELTTLLSEAEDALDEKINMNSAETQAKFNQITTALSSVTSVQGDLQSELSELKAETSADFSGVIEEVVHGVVTIKTDVSQGTGFIITNDGYVVTNYHVMQGAQAASIFTYDGQTNVVSRVGFNEGMDIAVLKIMGSFDELEIGDSDDVKIGEKVIAIGNPLGLSFTATEGIISARDRVGVNNLPFYFQTDVSLNPGNSGGPLINTAGEVIGINNFKISGAEGIGFALQINEAEDVINEISMEAINQTIV